MNQQEQQDFLLSTFREEVEGHVINLTRGLVDLEESEEGPERIELMRDIMRVLHTVKGSARMLGFADITRVAHAMEDLMGFYRNGKNGAVPREQVDLLFMGIDTISELVRFTTRQTEDGPGTPFSQLTQPEQINSLIDRLKELAGLNEEEPAQPRNQENGHESAIFSTLNPLESLSAALEAEPLSLDRKAETGAKGENRADETIRVRLDKLDSMINLAGELVINKLQNEEHLTSLQNLLAKNRQRSRLLQQLRDFVVDQTPLEERSRLLGLTELFSFGDEELKAAKKQFLESRSQKGSNANGSGNKAATSGDGMLDAKVVRKIYDKLEQLLEIDREVEGQLTTMVRERKRYNLNFETTADELRRNMLGIRMLPLDTLFSRFGRLVRDLANERGKQARLVVVGGNVEIDKRILEEISDPLRHLLQNAIDHGIETPKVREASGKSAEGTVTLSASQRGSHVHIKIQDDGAGLDAGVLLASALHKGTINSEEARSYNESDIYDLVFRPGFSTRQSVDEISGRGVGLDVVQQNIKRLSGRVSLITERDKGTTFTLEIPLTLATIDVLLVQTAGQLFALPSVMVEATLRPTRNEIVMVENKPTLRLRNQLVPVVRLDHMLNLPAAETQKSSSEQDKFQAVLLSASIGGTAGQDRGAERYICFEVDELVDEREVVVKALSKFLENVPNVAGATLLGADGLALILDTFGLVQTARQGGIAPVFSTVMAETTEIIYAPRARRILVVDDSLATRELERSILETAGYEVQTARDGADALQICRQNHFDLVLTDVEMPNMDGFRLTAALSSDERLRDIPVIVVSSRDSEEDKRRGLQAGAKAYIVKGQFEQNKLLETIARLVV